MTSHLRSFLHERLGRATCSLWIDPLDLHLVAPDHVELVAPDRYFCSWIEKNLHDAIRTALVDALQLDTVRLTLRSRTDHPAAAAPPSLPALPAPVTVAEQLRLPSMPTIQPLTRPLNPRYTFPEFVVGDSNAVAHNACLALAKGDTSLGRYIYLKAGTGLGKSHLTHAVANHILDSAPGTRLHYLTPQQMTAEMVKSIQGRTMDHFKEKFQHCDVLLMEGMQALTGKAKTQEELSQIFDVLLETGKKVIFTGALGPREIDSLDEGLRSRLASGLVATIDKPDLATRLRITQRKAANHQLALSEELAIYVAEQIKDDIRQIRSAVVGLKAKAQLMGRSPDLDMVREVLRDLVAQQHALTPESIRDFIAGQYNLSISDLQSKSRKKQIAFPRQVSMYLSRKFTDTPLADIGRAFHRDHSTVVHAIRVVSEAMTRNSSIRGQVDFLSEKLQAHFLA